MIGKKPNMRDRNEKLAVTAGNLDETQMVSLQDLEELERLQIAGAEKNVPTVRSRRAVPLSALLGLVAALALMAMLTAVYLHSKAQPVSERAAVAGSH